ncbi:MAG: PAS domain S-box protein, partial [Calditrichaceae bacterium]
MQKAKKWISSLNEVIDFKDLPLEVIFSKTLDILVENNENTNLAGAQIKFNNKVYRSKSFQQTEFVHHEIFLASIDVDGCIELYYKESKDQVHPFTEEDIVILSGLSKRLGNLICVKLANKALQNSDKKYQKIIERFNDPTYLLYNDRLEFVNDQFLKLFGYTRQEIEDEDFTFFRLIAPESIPLMEQRRRLLLDDKAIPSIYEFAALAKGNKKIICETSVSYLPYKSGTAVQGVIRDVTERRIAEQKLRDTKEQL